MYLCRDILDISLDQIGETLGGRDHTTVMHGVKKITQDVQNSESTSQLINTVKKKINPN